MKVIYVGDFSDISKSEVQIAEALENLGVEVVKFQESPDLDCNAVAKECESGTFFLWTRIYKELEKHIKEDVVNKISIPSVGLHLDIYFGLDREKDLTTPFWGVDYIFTPDGGHQKEFEEKGINHYWLSPGVVRSACYKGDTLKGFENIDVAFLGSYYYHSEWNYRKALIEWLQKTYGDRFALVGGDQVYYTHGKCFGKCKNDLFNTVPIMVGDSLYSPYYWSDRIPEILGRGGFLVHPFVEGLGKQYTYYKHFIPYKYGDFNTLKTIIDYFIEAEEERNHIRKWAMDFVEEYHTWENKMQYVIDVLGEDCQYDEIRLNSQK